jgi:pimeloyl-ACP methyl ester carboxylesterase
VDTDRQRLAFGLVHGGMHGAWCWERVAKELAGRGHEVRAVDLPCDDDAYGVSGYAARTAAALADVTAPVVLVGHSLGGITIPVVADRLPVRRMIFLSALLPAPGQTLLEQQKDEPEMLFPDLTGPPGWGERFYNTCTPDDAAWALGRLRRQSQTPHSEVTPLRVWPDVPAAYIVCERDHAVNPVWGRVAAERRLGVRPVELADTGHAPFIDRPEELAELFVRLGSE